MRRSTRPLANMLGSVRARELNLMLHDLARERNVAIVDVDAIAADLGSQRHAPDGVHGSGPLQAGNPRARSCACCATAACPASRAV